MDGGRVISRIEVLFEFRISTIIGSMYAYPRKRKIMIYRAVREAGGTYRMEKRGEMAKSFRPAMWCGSEESLHRFREAVEQYRGNKAVP